ncbi:AI-2E family transporter [Candidatus Roizmanbacteria bacterium]|nr:AI-2E family transporter [Candidatus Roizmanbacteria bacterium]
MEITIKSRTIFRIVLIVFISIGTIYLARILIDPLVWLLISFFLALALNPAVVLTKIIIPGHSHTLSVLIVFIVAIAFTILIGFVLIPPLIYQTQHLATQMPVYINNLTQSNTPLGEYIKKFDLTQNNLDKFFASITTASSYVLGFILSFFSGAVAFFTTLMFTFFMVLESPHWVYIFWKYQDESKREYRQRIAKRLYNTVTGYVNGNLFTSAIASFSIAIVLALVKAPSPITLGIMVGILNLVPMIGTPLATILVTLITFITNGFTSALIVLIFFLIYQQIENNVLLPLVYSKAVELSPLFVGIAAVFGAVLAGFVGALIAIPVAASIQILVAEYMQLRYSKSKNADKI